MAGPAMERALVRFLRTHALRQASRGGACIVIQVRGDGVVSRVCRFVLVVVWELLGFGFLYRGSDRGGCGVLRCSHTWHGCRGEL